MSNTEKITSTCQARIQQGSRTGELCERPTDNTTYCIKHIRQVVVDKALQDNLRYCDISRGCYTPLEEHQTKCKFCLHTSRIKDRKRDDKKRRDTNICLDCGIIMTNENRAKGKHDKLLRRCIPCYTNLLECESNRPARERNYKAEVFNNKYVIWNHYIKGAQKRSINFKISKTVFNEIIIKKCFYCDYTKDGEVNGIDRVDNNKGYIEGNIVACCKVCNIAKGTQHPQEFIDKMYSIYNYTINSIPIHYDILKKWESTYLSKSMPKYINYIKSANTRNIEFKLTEDDFNSIILKECYLCGLNTNEYNINGIDRQNNQKGYIIDNCKPCCGHCNLLKKDIKYEDIINNANIIYNKYNELTTYFKEYNVDIRSNKIEARIKVENPTLMEIEKRIYKPLNETIEPNRDIPYDIKKLLEQTEIKMKENESDKSIKQWKVKEIFDAISTNKENLYKEYCEQNNDMAQIKDWNTMWPTFVLSIKGQTFDIAEPIIRDFIENLRRIRHNALCYKKNDKLVDRDNRQQWPSTTVARAFLNGKLDTFKEYTEEQTGDDPSNLVWQKRWQSFVDDLEANKNDFKELKNLASKFLTAQRAKRYRHGKK
jgi:hypothetical protein